MPKIATSGGLIIGVKNLPPIPFHADSDTLVEVCKELNEVYSYFSTKDNVFSVMDQNSCYSFSSDGKYKIQGWGAIFEKSMLFLFWLLILN